MSIYEFVKERYLLPFELYEYQKRVVEKLAPLPRSGCYMDVGTGKSITSAVCALYNKEVSKAKIWVVMPPILLPMWKRMLDKIPGVSSVMYRGTKKKRSGIPLDKDFTLMSLNILKNDFDYLVESTQGQALFIILDEATSIKNSGSDNHKSIAYLVDIQGASLMMLTGTPISGPIDAYAYIKLLSPGTYRNLRHFENIHVESRDFFKNPSSWRNLDMLAENMNINAVRVTVDEALPELPRAFYTALDYELNADHYALYQKLATEELLELENGGKLDLTSQQALIHALGQIICNFSVFSENPADVSTIYELIDEVMSELGDRKLVVSASYRMTNRALIQRLEKYKAVAVYGEMTFNQQQAALSRFLEDPECRLISLQPTSAGFGLDGLQHVCSDMLFIETPTTPRHFHQTVARLRRGGQTKPVHVRMAVAEGTLQVRRFKQLLDNDELVNEICPSVADLRALIFGG